MAIDEKACGCRRFSRASVRLPNRILVSFTDGIELEEATPGEEAATKLPEPYPIEVREFEVFNEKIGMQAVDILGV